MGYGRSKGGVIGPFATLLALLGGGWYFFNHSSTTVEDLQTRSISHRDAPSIRPPASLSKPSDRLRIATFNIQTFALSKASNPTVMAILADILRRFDVIALQEVRSNDPQVLPALVEQVNLGGGQYRTVISDPLGNSTQKFFYAFVWDSQRLVLRPNSVFLVQDPNNRMHRQPFVASFQTNVVPVAGQQPFSFTLINVHTDPDEISSAKGERSEINVLAHVYKNVRAYMYPEDDVIILGDFNAAPRELGAFRSLYSTAGTEYTMTAAMKQNDYILIDPLNTKEFIYGNAGVIDYQRDLNIDLETAKSVSDHRPVWADFQIYEALQVAPPMATRAALP